MGVEYLNGVTMTPRSVKTADQTLSAPVEETQYKVPLEAMTPVPMMPAPSYFGGPARIGVAEEATTVDRFEGTPGEWLVCVTDPRRS